jgi:hypothetical protein
VRIGARAAILLFAALALAGAIAVGVAALTSRRAPPPFVTVALAGERLTIASAYLRPEARRDGAVEALELAAFYPDFDPAGEFGDVTAGVDLAERFARVVFVALKPASGDLDPAARTAKLYQRFLDENSWTHPGGLTARAFVDGSPFAGDELYYVAPDGREFAARCRRPDPARKTPNTCLYDFRLGDLDVEARFSAALLSEWVKLKEGARGLIEAAKR